MYGRQICSVCFSDHDERASTDGVNLSYYSNVIPTLSQRYPNADVGKTRDVKRIINSFFRLKFNSPKKNVVTVIIHLFKRGIVRMVMLVDGVVIGTIVGAQESPAAQVAVVPAARVKQVAVEEQSITWHTKKSFW